jgi:hypothetical protein
MSPQARTPKAAAMSKNLPTPAPDPSGDFILYQTEDGATRIEVRLECETVWLSQKAMAELFQTTPQNITMHITGLFDEGELAEAATCKDFLQVRAEGNRQVQRSVRHYNLDVIISVGYRRRQGDHYSAWESTRRGTEPRGRTPRPTTNLWPPLDGGLPRSRGFGAAVFGPAFTPGLQTSQLIFLPAPFTGLPVWLKPVDR